MNISGYLVPFLFCLNDVLLLFYFINLLLISPSRCLFVFILILKRGWDQTSCTFSHSFSEVTYMSSDLFILFNYFLLIYLSMH